MSIWYLATAAIVLGALAWRLVIGSASQARYPPGPKAHPFFGHSLQVPTIQTWRYFERLSHQYGKELMLHQASEIFLKDCGMQVLSSACPWRETGLSS